MIIIFDVQTLKVECKTKNKNYYNSNITNIFDHIVVRLSINTGCLIYVILRFFQRFFIVLHYLFKKKVLFSSIASQQTDFIQIY